MTDKQYKNIEQIEKHLTENELWVEDVWYNDLYYYVHISWGDWKHEHLRCDYLMEQIGYECTGTITTEEDGGDCYSAIHKYVKVR